MHTDRLAVERLQQRLTNLDEEFRTYHLGVVDLLEEEKDLENEQAALDNHDDRVTDLLRCLAKLATPEVREEESNHDPPWSLQRRLQYLEENLWKVFEAVFAVADEAEVD